MEAALVAALAGTLHVTAHTQPPGGSRRIELQGAPNLRDLGGYQTTDGRETRWGLLYRSGQLSALTAKDYETLARLGIVAVCDFRRDDERAAQPTKWKGGVTPQILALPPTADEGTPPPPNPVSATRSGGGPMEVANEMRASYASYPSRLAGSYRRVIDLILEGRGPVLYHCTAGKDRTGVFSAILLSLLGVPRETVFADYLLSNEYVLTPTTMANYAKANNTSLASVHALLSVETSYLDAAFAAIRRQHDSLDGYRREALKLSDEEIERLEARLLTAASSPSAVPQPRP
jgi:protein-tyrosine phosphatase